jgi:hypothetical protein
MAMGVNSQHFDTWNPNVNMYVPDAQYSADIDYMTGEFRADFGAPPAISANGIIAAGNWAAAGSINVFAPTYTRNALAPFGRQLSLVGPATTTNVVTIRGRDYLGQPILETLTLNSATPVNTLKIYRWVESFSYTADPEALAINVGWTDVFGLPYRTLAVQNWFEDNAGATPGTFTPGASTVVAQTAASSDPRGGVDFTSASNGVRTFAIIGICDLTELYGIAHFGG